MLTQGFLFLAGELHGNNFQFILNKTEKRRACSGLLQVWGKSMLTPGTVGTERDLREG